MPVKLDSKLRNPLATLLLAPDPSQEDPDLARSQTFYGANRFHFHMEKKKTDEDNNSNKSHSLLTSQDQIDETLLEDDIDT